MPKLKQFADVILVGYLSKPRIVTNEKGTFVFAGLSTSIREKLETGEVITRVETWHNLAARTPVAADSIRLFNAKNRTVQVEGRLTRRTFEHKGQKRTVCEIQVFKPIIPASDKRWQGIAEIQGTLARDPHVVFPHPDEPWQVVQSELSVKTERPVKNATSPRPSYQYFNVVYYGEKWVDMVRDLKTGNPVRILTTLDYGKDETDEKYVEYPQLSGLSLLNQAEILNVDRGFPLPDDWSRFLPLAV